MIAKLSAGKTAQVRHRPERRQAGGLPHGPRRCNLSEPSASTAAREDGDIMATSKHYTHITFEARVSRRGGPHAGLHGARAGGRRDEHIPRAQAQPPLRRPRRPRRAPFVCNGCARRHKCPPERRAYSAKADSRLVESREGLDMTGREMASWPPRSRRAWRRADHMLALI